MEPKLSILKKLTFEILEDMCFLLETAPEISRQDFESPRSIKIECGQEYVVIVTVDENLSVTIAENLMGIPAKKLNRELVQSAVQEVTNMIGGNFMNQMEMATDAKLSIPAPITDGDMEQYLKPENAVNSTTLYINNYPLDLTIIEQRK
ncbi:MAG: chemotaxis protein CheX [Candidatus Marinimicrobia bacterium]|nr:chemotaxis protein CheX [Candidatus Neomarinimicrobiota bacterium]MCF7880488.1 chemotaxis protein CheX [Candidatus Neomarinimicrobiota bacterium]